MSIGSTRKISSSSAPSKVSGRSFMPNNHSQFVENIDTRNNVLVRDDDEREHRRNEQESPAPQKEAPDFNNSTLDASTNIETLIMSEMLNSSSETTAHSNKVDVYTNNQSMIKDKEVERTGRTYLKHFYEKNEHIVDVDEFV